MTAASYTIARSTPVSRVAAIAGLALCLFLAAAPWWAGRADLRLMSEIFLYLSLASLWNLVAGYAGLVSVCQQAFVGFGGYMLFAFTMFLGISPLLAIPIAGILGAAVALPVAILIFRLRGAYFAIGTWVIAEVFRLVFAQVSDLGGGSGTSLPIDVECRSSSGVLAACTLMVSGPESANVALASGKPAPYSSCEISTASAPN